MSKPILTVVFYMVGCSMGLFRPPAGIEPATLKRYTQRVTNAPWGDCIVRKCVVNCTCRILPPSQFVK